MLAKATKSGIIPLATMAIMVALAGCKAKAPVTQVPVMSRVELRPRLVPVRIPDDSALLRLQLECDSAKGLLITALDELKGTAVKTGLTFNEGILVYGSRFKPSVQYIPVLDSIVERGVPIEVIRTVEVNVLYGWQKFLMWMGGLFLAIITVKIILYAR